MKNAWSAQFGIGPDEIAIAYYNDSEKIITTVVKGNCSASSPDYAVLDDLEHLVVRTPGILTTSVSDPAISGSSNGEYQVTWTDYNSGIAVNTDYIYGRIFRSEKLFYLPLLPK